MTNSNDILFNKDLRTGGFYELAIQVCPSANNEPIKTYTDYIWTLKNVVGPFDVNHNSIPIDIKHIQHLGVLHIDNYAIPFMTYNIREDEPYPNTIKQRQEEETELTIKDALADGKEISIRAFQLPIINRELLETDLETKTDLSELFESTRQELINKIEKILVLAMYIEH